MIVLEPRDPDWEERVRTSFSRQPFMTHLGAELTRIAPGAVDIELGYRKELTQQHGFFHAGGTSSIADSAAGYSALSLYPAGTGVLTTEFKINLLNPARQERLVARGRVLKPGRTLTICRADVYGLSESEQVHVATGLFSMICLEGVED
jgi:uncharacterized protein (TIGR00369 family)